jgi:hypothetical protein
MGLDVAVRRFLFFAIWATHINILCSNYRVGPVFFYRIQVAELILEQLD